MKKFSTSKTAMNHPHIDQAQLKILFDQENPLAMRLRHGQFSYLFEVDTPATGQSLAKATAMSGLLAKQLSTIPWATGMTITDRLSVESCHDPVATANRIGEASGKPIIMNISGKGSSSARVRELAARGQSEGIQTILAITGDRSDRQAGASNFKIMAANPNGYTDSVETIRLLSSRPPPKLLLGGGVNPFKYNLPDQYLQYYKMLRKIATGAAFITTNIGWDMKKYQELKWFLQMREIEVPVIARLTILSRKLIRQLHHGFIPGVPLSRAFCAILQRESEISEAQSMAAQMRRLALQVAGCRLLGFSGVQIAGIHNGQSLDLVLKSLAQSPDGVKSYEDWLQAWQNYHAEIDFGPGKNAYYMFSNLLQPQYQNYCPSQSQLTEGDFPEVLNRDRLRWWLIETGQRSWMPGIIKEQLKSRFCKSHQMDTVKSATWFHLCPSACPKRLVLGPCGGSQLDGLCEFGHAPCFHHRILALAARTKRLDQLETGILTEAGQ